MSGGYDGGHGGGDNEFEFSKDVNIDVNADIDFNVDVDFEKDVDICVDIDVNTDVEGNTALLTLDVEAIGTDTFVEVTSSVLAVEDTLSQVTVVAEAVVG